MLFWIGVRGDDGAAVRHRQQWRDRQRQPDDPRDCPGIVTSFIADSGRDDRAKACRRASEPGERVRSPTFRPLKRQAPLPYKVLAGVEPCPKGWLVVSAKLQNVSMLPQAPEVQSAIRDAEQALAGRGRVLVRPSGTEPLVRVMVEAPTEREAEDTCRRLVTLVERALG